MRIMSSLFDEIKKGQDGDVELDKVKISMVDGRKGSFELHDDGSLRYKGRWCVPTSCEECYNTPYFVYPGGDKLYKDVKKQPRIERWW